MVQVCISQAVARIYIVEHFYIVWHKNKTTDVCQHKRWRRHWWQKQINRDICTKATPCSCMEVCKTVRGATSVELFVVWQPGTYFSLLNNKVVFILFFLLLFKVTFKRSKRNTFITFQATMLKCLIIKWPVEHLCLIFRGNQENLMLRQNQTYWGLLHFSFGDSDSACRLCYE